MAAETDLYKTINCLSPCSLAFPGICMPDMSINIEYLLYIWL